jgi:phage-related protein
MEIILTPRIDGEFNKMEDSLHLKISKEIELLGKFGTNLYYPHVKQVSGKIWELRAVGNLQIRIFYTIKKNKAYIFDYFFKKEQKIPTRILKRVEKRYKEVG